MKRALVLVLAWAMFVVLPTSIDEPTADAAAAAAQIRDDQQPGHAVDMNSSGDAVIAAVKESGQLNTRTFVDGAWSAWRTHGFDNWVSADVAINDLGEITLLGLKQSGALWTQDWTPAAGWSSFAKQGRATWATNTIPSIDKDGDTTSLAAVKESGALFTRRRIDGSGWESWTKHGRANWTHGDIGVHEGGFVVLAGTKQDGKLYTRIVSPQPGQWELHGRSDWSIDVPPSLSLYFDELALAAVKADGRAFVRVGTFGIAEGRPAGLWTSFTSVGTNVASIAAAGGQGQTVLAYVGTSGELTSTWVDPQTGYVPSGGAFFGFSGWSASVPVSVAQAPRDGFGSAILQVRSNGQLTINSRYARETQYTNLGRPTWATGPDLNLAPVERSEYRNGLHLVGADALPPGRYQIEAAQDDDCNWIRSTTLAPSIFTGEQGQNFVIEGAVGIVDVLPTDRVLETLFCDSLRPYDAPPTVSTSFGPGIHVVGGDIAPGRYLSEGGCSWSRLRDFEGAGTSRLGGRSGFFLGQHIIDVLATDVGVQVLDRCQFSPYTAPASPASEVGPGTYVVGSDIAPGRYVMSAGCGFERVNSFAGGATDTIGGFPRWHSPSEQGEWVVDIESTDVGFLLGHKSTGLCAARPYVASTSPLAAPGFGTNIVGVDVEPGIYSAPGGEGCFYAYLDGFGWSNNDLSTGFRTATSHVSVTILDTDAGFFASSFCGEWSAATQAATGSSHSLEQALGDTVSLLIPSFDVIKHDAIADDRLLTIEDFDHDPATNRILTPPPS